MLSEDISFCAEQALQIQEALDTAKSMIPKLVDELMNSLHDHANTLNILRDQLILERRKN